MEDGSDNSSVMENNLNENEDKNRAPRPSIISNEGRGLSKKEKILDDEDEYQWGADANVERSFHDDLHQ